MRFSPYPRGIRLLLTVLWITPLRANAQQPTTILPGQFDPTGTWQLTLELEESEFKALEPVAPQIPAFGVPVPGSPGSAGASDREHVPNLLGTRFPWVRGVLKIESAGPPRSYACRLRYDGDFTYMMSAVGPKRPMFVELLDDKTIQGAEAFRLHPMVFDTTLMREIVATHLFAELRVPVPRSTHAELSLRVRGGEPQKLGLCTALEVVDAEFLKRLEISPETLILQINGLNSLQYLGAEWTTYTPMFRGTPLPNEAQRARIIAFAKLINESGGDEFASKIAQFINTQHLLRYVAANSMTSNLTGLATLGVHDFLCLDPQGQFHLVASDLEISLGGSVLSGTPEQLTNLSITHPYASNCMLLDRMGAQRSLSSSAQCQWPDLQADSGTLRHGSPRNRNGHGCHGKFVRRKLVEWRRLCLRRSAGGICDENFTTDGDTS